jgi:hypothetical protein
VGLRGLSKRGQGRVHPCHSSLPDQGRGGKALGCTVAMILWMKEYGSNAISCPISETICDLPRIHSCPPSLSRCICTRSKDQAPNNTQIVQHPDEGAGVIERHGAPVEPEVAPGGTGIGARGGRKMAPQWQQLQMGKATPSREMHGQGPRLRRPVCEFAHIPEGLEPRVWPRRAH